MDGVQVIVGLGNPEPQYANTPHNIGYEVLDRLATSLGLAWQEGPHAWTARGTLENQAVCLVKLRVAMNLSGAALKRLSQSLGFTTEQCILVYDDLDLPLGAARTRMGGGAGGHRGVASILEAYQSSALRRVKVGVGQAGATHNRADYVLTPFAADRHTELATGIATAHARLLELSKSHPS